MWIGQLLWTCSDFKFSVGDSLDGLSGIQFRPPKRTRQTRQFCRVWRVGVNLTLTRASVTTKLAALETSTVGAQQSVLAPCIPIPAVHAEVRELELRSVQFMCRERSSARVNDFNEPTRHHRSLAAAHTFNPLIHNCRKEPLLRPTPLQTAAPERLYVGGLDCTSQDHRSSRVVRCKQCSSRQQRARLRVHGCRALQLSAAEA